MSRKTPQSPDLKTYVVTADGRVAGKRRKQGDELQMTESAARYEPRLALKSEPKPAKASKPATESAAKA
ncbi:hypothetical protein SAMN05421853_102110 [Roseivivax halotolerans]|uniref:Uncharacterized protein n=1 Tax=Roseivivax halotolerans TaxID=93684 RepID=A0A1I5W3T8_9RHOB|nr:hypothetical protein [Roseivivax halotolerans]SFQ14414.1 hypothetical protein SAMN05421853_102110 [Roseivivax halotolerans]